MPPHSLHVLFGGGPGGGGHGGVLKDKTGTATKRPPHPFLGHDDHDGVPPRISIGGKPHPNASNTGGLFSNSYDETTTYNGCLNMTLDELKDAWIFSGPMPICTGGISDTSSNILVTTATGGEDQKTNNNNDDVQAKSGSSSAGSSSSSSSASDSSTSTSGTKSGETTNTLDSETSKNSSSSSETAVSKTNTYGTDSARTSETNSSGGDQDNNGSSSVKDVSNVNEEESDSNEGEGKNQDENEDNASNNQDEEDETNAFGQETEATGSFDISKCDEYSNVWLWDLAFTCQDLDTYSGCLCQFASMKFNNGEIKCAQPGDPSPPACPPDCHVCQTCMILLGCDDIYEDVRVGVGAFQGGFMGTLAVAAYAGGLLGALGLLYAFRRTRSGGGCHRLFRRRHFKNGLVDGSSFGDDDHSAATRKAGNGGGDSSCQPPTSSAYSLDSTDGGDARLV